MTVPPFNASVAIVDSSRRPTAYFQTWIGSLNQAFVAVAASATAAVPASRNVVASGGLQVGGSLGSDVGLAFYKVMVPVAHLPGSGNKEGDWAYALNGRKPGEAAGAGTGVPVFWSNAAWCAVTSGAAVTA